MLRAWNFPTPVSLWTDVDEKQTDEVPVWREEQGDDEPTVSKRLSTEQRQELATLLAEYKDVLSNTPGRTSLVEHRIVLKEKKAIRQPPYRLAHAHRSLVQKELKEMLEAGII